MIVSGVKGTSLLVALDVDIIKHLKGLEGNPFDSVVITPLSRYPVPDNPTQRAKGSSDPFKPEMQFEFPEPVAVNRDEQLGFDEFDDPDDPRSPYVGKTIIFDIVILSSDKEAGMLHNLVEERLTGWKPDGVRSLYLDFQQPLTMTEGDEVPNLSFLRYIVEADGDYQPLTYTT